jgi:transaldolase
MRIFLDTAAIAEIKKGLEWGLVDGVTTNPSLIAREKKPYREALKEVLALVPGPVSCEVLATEAETMVDEAKTLAALGKNAVIKIPFTPAGVQAVRRLKPLGIPVNQTLVFSPNQALIAAKAGAAYVSPFVGRLDDIGHDGMELVAQILEIYANYGYDTEVIVASVRHPDHVRKAALLGAHIATVPFGVLEQCFKHPLTDIGLEKFLADIRKAGIQW